MIFLFLFVLGAIVGSFLNVVALRFNTGLSLGGHSKCATCERALGWWELVPVLGFFFVGGKCRSCKSKISPQYPAVEVFTGLIFVTLATAYPTYLSYFVSLTIFCLYVVILIYDARHKIIPDRLSYTAIVIALALRLFALPFHSMSDWWAGPILFAFFALIWVVSRGRAMGFGDAKLALSIGLLLGLANGVSAIVLAFWIGTVVSLVAIFALRRALSRGRKGLTMKSEVPFAPFMIIGAWLALIFHLDIFHVLSF